MSVSRNTRAALWLAAAITLLAFGLRAFRLDGQSLWYDEGATWYVASQPWPQLLTVLTTIDVHPPLFYALLKLWMGIAGQSDFALRFPSVLAGTASIPVVYSLAQRLLARLPHPLSPSPDVKPLIRLQPNSLRRERGWPQAGGEAASLIAALFLALNPPHIVFSQELRMYALAVLLSGISVYLTLGWFEARGLKTALAYTLVTAALLSTNYVGGLVIVFENAVVLIALVELRRGGRLRNAFRALWAWVASQLVLLTVLFLLLPLIRAALSHNFIWRPALTLPQMAADVWVTLTIGPPLPSWQPQFSIPISIALAVLGFAAIALAGWRRALVIALYVLIPAGLFIGAALWRPIYTGRYLLYLVLPMAVIVGAGCAALARAVTRLMRRWTRPRGFGVAAGAGTAALIAVFGFGLTFATAVRAYYFDPAYAREDFRSVAAHVQGQEKSGEALVLLNSAYPFLHYYSGALPHLILPPGLDWLADEAQVVSALNGLTPPPTRVWLVGWQWQIFDPQDFVETQLRAHGVEVGEQWWSSAGPRAPIRAAAYDLASAGFTAEPRRPLDVRFGDGALRLMGYNLHGRLEPGGRAFLSLWWELDGPPPAQATVFTHLFAGKIFVAGSDKLPLNHLYPFRVWPQNQSLHDVVVLDLPADAPSPPYTLEVGLYDSITQQRLVALGQPLKDRVALPLNSP